MLNCFSHLRSKIENQMPKCYWKNQIWTISISGWICPFTLTLFSVSLLFLFLGFVFDFGFFFFGMVKGGGGWGNGSNNKFSRPRPGWAFPRFAIAPCTLLCVCVRRIDTFLVNRAFSFTWQTAMQIFYDKRRRLHKKRVKLPRDWLRTPTWRTWLHLNGSLNKPTSPGTRRASFREF